MFTADVPGVARSASGEMARTAESRLCRERPDRGSGRLTTPALREVPYVTDAKGRKRALTPEVAALAAHAVLVVRELTPARRGAASRRRTWKRCAPVSAARDLPDRLTPPGTRPAGLFSSPVTR